MLIVKYDPRTAYSFLQYGRMSDKDLQNERSPDQQFQMIASKIERLGYPWKHLKTYRDDGVAGTYLSKRKDFQRMLREIEMGIVRPNLIVVDTAERLGRADEIGELRRKLQTEYGILVTTADKDFADPTGVVGKSVMMLETFRSIETTRIIGHNVVRGKVDKILRGQWPGGPPPLGMKLRKVLKTIEKKESAEHNAVVKKPPAEQKAGRKREEIESYLEIEEADRPYVLMAFNHALRTGHGADRLTNWWNASPEIPDRLKPMSMSSMMYMLKNELYIGRMVWGANVTGVVSEVRVVQANPEGCHVAVDDYCEPIVEVDVFKPVNEMIKLRSDLHNKKKSAKAVLDSTDSGLPHIATQGRGLSLVYLLSGLVRCECGASMRTSASGTDRKDGMTYVYYYCPHAMVGACPNRSRVREERLRPAVIDTIKRRMFPAAGNDGLPEWYPELAGMIEQELSHYRDEGPARSAARKEEISKLGESIQGWSMTLAMPSLPASVRESIAGQFEAANLRMQGLIAEDEQEAAAINCLAEAISPSVVSRELSKLDQAMAAENVTMSNLVLGHHIDRILSTRDGKVELVGTFLGVFGDALGLLVIEPPDASKEVASVGKRHRKRTKLFVPSLTAPHTKRLTKPTTSLDPDRFAGYPAHYFWREEIVLEKTQCWAQIHALEVAAKRRRDKLSIEALAAEYDVTPPTIRHALKIAVTLDPSFADLPKKSPRARWEDSHFTEVAKLKAEGWSVPRLSEHFGKSEPLIRAALKLAEGRDRS